MRCVLLASSLADALTVAGRAVGTDRTLPTVGHVLLEATPDGGLTVTGDDRRIRAWTTAEADIEEAGSICLPKMALDGFLGAVTAFGDVSLTVDPKGRSVLSCGPTVVKVAGMAAENFPAAPGLDGVQAELSLDVNTLAALVSSTEFAADRKPDNNPIRECVHIAIQGGVIRCEATDGLRVARRVLTLKDVPDLDVLVPSSALTRAMALIGGKGSVRLAVTPTHLLIDVEAAHVALLRSTGTFPDVERIMPKESASRVTVDRAALAQALKLVLHLEKTAVGYRADLAISETGMEITASDRSTDHEASTTIPIDLDGDPVTLAMTATHMAQALDALSGHERIEMLIQSPNHPVLIQGAGSDEQAHILMPIIAAR